MAELMQRLSGVVDGVVMINSPSRLIVDPSGASAFGTKRERAGLMGGAVFDIASGCVRSAVELIRRDKLALRAMHAQPVNEIVLDPTRTPDLNASVRALARVIAPIAPLITGQVIREKLDATPGRAITAVGLRDSDMEVLAGDPRRVPGVVVNRSDQLVMADRRLSSPLEDGLTNYWQAIRDATAGWQVANSSASTSSPTGAK